MILIAYTRRKEGTSKSKMDYTSVPDMDAFVDWFFKLGDKPHLNLPTQDTVLTEQGWIPNVVKPAICVMENKDTTHNMVISIKKIVSDEGILFEDIKHCSMRIVDYMALKCVKR